MFAEIHCQFLFLTCVAHFNFMKVIYSGCDFQARIARLRKYPPPQLYQIHWLWLVYLARWPFWIHFEDSNSSHFCFFDHDNPLCFYSRNLKFKERNHLFIASLSLQSHPSKILFSFGYHLLTLSWHFLQLPLILAVVLPNSLNYAVLK